MHRDLPTGRTDPADSTQFFDNEKPAARAARDVSPGESWVFVEHRTLAEVIAAERRQ